MSATASPEEKKKSLKRSLDVTEPTAKKPKSEMAYLHITFVVAKGDDKKDLDCGSANIVMCVPSDAGIETVLMNDDLLSTGLRMIHESYLNDSGAEGKKSAFLLLEACKKFLAEDKIHRTGLCTVRHFGSHSIGGGALVYKPGFVFPPPGTMGTGISIIIQLDEEILRDFE